MALVVEITIEAQFISALISSSENDSLSGSSNQPKEHVPTIHNGSFAPVFI